ncbi:putative DNA alkylation repair protein [Kribbella flavida DSM 17836]|uniref:Putative DNA alkylation repair protein n=1 Tax=Kribbella flavida (strain DSM 17836 / JCM 10339 / NBRC 14399) TaxID=479435 RepID=D2Q3H2_KRIFD|nr:DNA alkylation repair protein [Kribbella flavida]ADB34095.1 putative DNA alkylation repair protein [Kribbella flavida DSM 17836]
MPTAEEMLSTDSVVALGAVLRKVEPGLRFAALTAVPGKLAGTSFSERGLLVRDALLADLPAGYAPVEQAIRAALTQPEFTGWMIWPVTEAVAVRATSGTEGPQFEAGLELLAALTPRLTAEFAVRTFLAADLDRTLAVVTGWTKDPDEHVRRLASEGTRPRLPWAKQVRAILARPGVTRPVLEALRRDDSPYVRRSVANHLNDVSRSDPALAVEIAAGWLADPAPTTAQLVRHALRSLIKAGDPAALALLGFEPPGQLSVDGPTLSVADVAVGESLEFSFNARNDGAGEVRLAIDYVVHHVKANGSLAPKVFKLTTRTLAPGEAVTLGKRHSFKPISTRRYYPGEHALELQINGRPFGRATFTLTTERPRKPNLRDLNRGRSSGRGPG